MRNPLRAPFIGDVMDATGARLPGATIQLFNQGTGATRQALTNEVGSYRFNALPPVEYAITVEFAGFATQIRVMTKSPVADLRCRRRRARNLLRKRFKNSR